MVYSKSILSSAALVASTFAQTAIVTIEASHGGAGNDLTNTTIAVPIGAIYTNISALDEVSYLFLTGAEGTPVDSITCTPYISTNGTGSGGLPFNSTNPSYLSTNTVQVGSIVCRNTGSGSGLSSSSSTSSSSILSSSSSSVAISTPSSSSTSNWTMSASVTTTASNPPSATPTSTPSSTPSSSYIPQTSTYITYVTPSGATTPVQSTVTSIYQGETTLSSSNVDSQPDATSATAASSPSVQSDENAAQLASSPYTFFAIAFGLLGFGFWL